MGKTRRTRLTYEKGRMHKVPQGQYVYLGWQVRDYKPKGLSHVKEVKGILREMDEDLKHGVSPRTINARSRILFLAVLHDQDLTKQQKKAAIKAINEWRKKHGWKPFEIKKPL